MHLPLAIALALVAADPPGEAEHARNPVYQAVRTGGLAVGPAAVRLPDPTFPDGQTADEQRAALRALAGSDRAADGLLRDSVTAPFLLKLRDIDGPEATIRAGDLYFVIRADLDALDPATMFLDRGSGGPVEAGNMRVEARVLEAAERVGTPAEATVDGEAFVHATGRLLDRIAVEATDHLTASRTADSVVVAARTDPRFGVEGPLPNRWRHIDGRGREATLGPPQPYAGGVGYAKLSRLRGVPGAVVVEIHFAFAEPNAWFDGAPILRSKFSLIAQDQIRRLRRALAEAGAGAGDGR